MAVEPEELAMWFSGGHKKPVQPAPQDLEERFKEATDVIDTKLNKFEQSLELMIRLTIVDLYKNDGDSDVEANDFIVL